MGSHQRLDQSTTSSIMSSSQTSPSKASAEDRASSLFQSGKRHFLMKNIPAAVSEFSETCEILSARFGDKAVECSEAYLYYGKSLLELSKLENVVLCNALEGVDIEPSDANEDVSQVENPDTLPAEEKAAVEEQVAEALEENFEKFDKIASIHSVEDVEDEDSLDDAMEEEVDEKAMETTEPEKEKNEETETAEDTDNLQLSWEVVELAKAGFQKIATEATSDDKKKEAWSRYCETIKVLGEISLENENYKQAVEDLTMCLEKRKEILPSDSRSIAETHYELGIAQGHMKSFTEAETSFQSAIGVLQTRIGSIRKMESSDNLDEEVEELESLVKEIQGKIKEHKEVAENKMDVSAPGGKMEAMQQDVLVPAAS